MPKLLPSLQRQYYSKPSTRFNPGTWITLIGSGFTKDSRVLVNEEQIYGSNVEFVDSRRLRCRLIRPNSAPFAPEGEQITVKVSLPDGRNVSNGINLVLDTFRMMVFGDSVQWGQGLNEENKFYALVAKQLRATHSEQGFYVDVKAHSGATIEVREGHCAGPYHGEIPCSGPTVRQQVKSVEGDKSTVDLILLDGGINDLGIFTIINPATPVSELRKRAYEYFYEDLKSLLETIVTDFTGARVIVTGYYPFISEESDSTLLTALLVGVGIGVASIPGAIVGGVLASFIKKRIIENTEVVADLANGYLGRAVQEVAHDTGAQVLFAQPEFKAENALFAPDPWVWDMDQDRDIYPDDPCADFRGRECKRVGLEGFELTTCKWASVGHPNVKGTQEYARVIQSLL